MNKVTSLFLAVHPHTDKWHMYESHHRVFPSHLTSLVTSSQLSLPLSLVPGTSMCWWLVWTSSCSRASLYSSSRLSTKPGRSRSPSQSWGTEVGCGGNGRGACTLSCSQSGGPRGYGSGNTSCVWLSASHITDSMCCTDEWLNVTPTSDSFN